MDTRALYHSWVCASRSLYLTGGEWHSTLQNMALTRGQEPVTCNATAGRQFLSPCGTPVTVKWTAGPCLGASRCPHDRWGSACWLPATGLRTLCGTDACRATVCNSQAQLLTVVSWVSTPQTTWALHCVSTELEPICLHSAEASLTKGCWEQDDPQSSPRRWNLSNLTWHNTLDCVINHSKLPPVKTLRILQFVWCKSHAMLQFGYHQMKTTWLLPSPLTGTP
jgi:hypothetical protein